MGGDGRTLPREKGPGGRASCRIYKRARQLLSWGGGGEGQQGPP